MGIEWVPWGSAGALSLEQGDPPRQLAAPGTPLLFILALLLVFSYRGRHLHGTEPVPT